ncbi:MAG: peptidase C11 [Clostridia bacterium]|nr:peptidase C11 [Clostridia bacterium]
MPSGGYTQSTSQGTTSGTSTTSGGTSSLFGGATGTGTSDTTSLFGGATGTESSGASGLTDLLSALMGSSSSSVYDAGSDVLSLFQGGGSSGSASLGGSSVSTSAASGAYTPDNTVSKSARAKYTTIQGKQKDTVTILIYLCGTDLESQNGMGTSDLKEMAAATLGKNVNLIVYTGGCKRWRNNVLSSSVNQIYQIQDGKLYCLEKDMGSVSMTNPDTLTKFIRYGAEHFPANRMCLIFWDHGGGSVSGYGYDEKYASSRSMSLAGINTALKSAGQKFDFIGFDACLMATVENGIMLSQYADYMIASEETEPGVGWYYTNWLTQLGKNTSMPTVEIGKLIADDFVAVCDRQCRGQGTTLSVVDLAELQATVPSELTSFSKATNELIQNNEYKTVSTARSQTREFAQSSRIDQIDLVHFAQNLGTTDGKNLAKALQGAVKYNRTGGSIRNAYGLSIYFPYKRTSKVNQMVSTYQAIGMDAEYTRCIQEFASLELSGQAAAGTSMTGYSSQQIGMPSLLGSLLGGSGSSSGASFGIPSSAGDMTDLLGGLFGTSASDDLFGFFSGRSMTAEHAAAYLSQHHLDVAALAWSGDRITLSDAQWGEVESLARNVFVDDGEGYIDLGMDSEFTLEDGALVDTFDGTCLSIDGQPIAYYYLGTEDDGESYAISGYSPALLNGTRVNLMLLFDDEHPYGVITGAEPVYTAGETEAQAKNLIQVGQGDQLQFLCDYYDYQGNYRDSYYLGQPVVLGTEVEIANTPIGSNPCRVTYCFTDYYQQRYWTPARIYSSAQ